MGHGKRKGGAFTDPLDMSERYVHIYEHVIMDTSIW